MYRWEMGWSNFDGITKGLLPCPQVMEQNNPGTWPTGQFPASENVFCFLSTIMAMATLAYLTLEPVNYRGSAMPRGHFHSVTPP